MNLEKNQPDTRNCSNTDCNGNSTDEVKTVVLNREFDSHQVDWCEDCISRDSDMVMAEFEEVEVMAKSRGIEKQSAFFYGNRNAGNTTIAEAEDENGNLYQLVSTGEIKVKVDGEIYRNNEIETLIEEKELTDNDLNSDKVEILSNNWFEVIWQNEDGNRWNSEIGKIAHLYKEGIQLLEKYAKNCYAKPENQTEVTA